MTTRYVNVKTYTRTVGSCVIRSCTEDATVTSTRVTKMRMDVRHCAEHAQQRGLI